MYHINNFDKRILLSFLDYTIKKPFRIMFFSDISDVHMYKSATNLTLGVKQHGRENLMTKTNIRRMSK